MIDDGGPAFPTKRIEDGIKWTQDGMSMRDHFAESALDVAFQFYTGGYCGNDGELNDAASATIAAVAYEIADAMIAARKDKSCS